MFNIISFSLEQELIGADCFTVYLKKEKLPYKRWNITYHLTQPVQPYQNCFKRRNIKCIFFGESAYVDEPVSNIQRNMYNYVNY